MNAKIIIASILVLVAVALVAILADAKVLLGTRPIGEPQRFMSDDEKLSKHERVAQFQAKKQQYLADKKAGLTNDATKFKNFLSKLHTQNGMPLSYEVFPKKYWKHVPEAQRDHHYNTSHYIVPCGNISVNYTLMNDYMWQTEQMLTGNGLNIYDGAVWCTAMTLLGEYDQCAKYLNNYLVDHKTFQFANIRANNPCKGVEDWGECSDPDQDGACGLCYGNGKGNAAKTTTVTDAYFFRMISDIWSYEGTTDARCPQLKHPWTWNDYKPILGENAWANLLGPANVAMIQYGDDPTKIPDSDPLFTLGIGILGSLQKMKVGSTGGFFFCPHNTWFSFHDKESTPCSSFSVENQASLLGGLKALNFIISANSGSKYASYLPQIQEYIADLKKVLLSAFSTKDGFFRQGATYNRKTGALTWGQEGQPNFAVDCQTWVSTILGAPLIDKTFGARTTYKLWQTVKKIASWECPSGGLCGIGYTYNTKEYGGQVFSGEWTYGAVNMLETVIATSGYDAADISSLQNDVEQLNMGLYSYLWTAAPINGSKVSYDAVWYSNKRYWIPFGWYANQLPATSSTGWAVMVLSKRNPFCVDKGAYKCSY